MHVLNEVQGEPIKMRRSTATQTTREEFCAYASGTTLHGISHVVKKTSYLKRVVWLVVFLCLLGWFLTYFIDRTVYFLSVPTTTKITVHRQESLQFPAVTFCNYNLLKKSVVNSNSEYKSIGQLMANLSFNGQFDLDELTSQTLDSDMTDFVNKAAHTLEETLIYCTFLSYIPCKNYFTSTMSKSGKCYTFNSHDVIKQHGLLFNVTRTGLEFGLRLRMDIMQEEYFAGFSFSAGIKVHVHHPNTFPPVDRLGFGVMPATETMCAIYKIHRSDAEAMKASRDDSCLDTEHRDFINPLRYYKYYSSYACKQECLTNVIIKNCSCIPYYLQGNNHPACTVNETFGCAFEVEVAFFLDIRNERGCNCKSPCSDIYYTNTLSSAAFPSEHMAEQIQSTYALTREYIDLNLLELRIYFEDLAFDKIEQLPSYTSSDFQGDVGGQLGLCLGASLLTVLEFFEFLYTLIKRLCCGTNEKKETNTTDGARERTNNPTITSALSLDYTTKY